MSAWICELPWPPTDLEIWKHLSEHGKLRPTRLGDLYLRDAARPIGQVLREHTRPIRICLTFIAPENRRHYSLKPRIEPILWVLRQCGAFCDLSQIEQLCASLSRRREHDGRVIVNIRETKRT